MYFDELSFQYLKSKKKALDKVSLEIPQGSIFALLGPNGAGKTTMLRIITGALKADSGSLKLDESLCDSNNKLDGSKYGVLIENPGVYQNMKVYEYLEFFGYFYKIKNLDGRIKELCEMIVLPLDVKLKNLSLGMKQKLQLIRSILHKPKLIMLDEPSANLDPEARQQIWDMILKIKKENDSSFIICSHVLSEIEKYSTHIAFIKEGKVIKSGKREDLLNESSNKKCIYRGKGLNILIPFFEKHFKQQHNQELESKIIESNDLQIIIECPADILEILNADIIKNTTWNDECSLHEMSIKSQGLTTLYNNLMRH